MSNLDEPQSRQWSEWDRETTRTEMSLEVHDNQLVIRATVSGQEVGRLQATLLGKSLVVTEIYIPKEVKISKRKGLFSKAAAVSGRGRGYGTLLVRALLAYARRNDAQDIVGGLRAEDLQENRYALEWYSRRGFITERVPTSAIPDSVATIRFLL
jgi:GNAT superfamily N-acetyltransferase